MSVHSPTSFGDSEIKILDYTLGTIINKYKCNKFTVELGARPKQQKDGVKKNLPGVKATGLQGSISKAKFERLTITH